MDCTIYVAKTKALISCAVTAQPMFADHKSSYLYENLPVQTKMEILSGKLILLAMLFYEQFIHYTQINLCPNKQLLSTQQQAYQSFLSYFLL